ncbi:zyxin [Drosophila madeirensis]|uniref:Zyxin n=1 Tax=Drosophila madeirensis TaxID=30013 RepID=A0AAU9FVW7_DROMD
MAALHHLLLVIVTLSAVQAVLSPPPGYDDDNSPLQLRLEDLERERERERELELEQDLEQHFDVNRPPVLPNHYEWRPGVAASLPPSYVQDAAQRERQLEELRQLQRQHQQLSAGYAFPAHLPPSVFYVGPGPTAATPTHTTTPTATATAAATAAATTATSARLLRPIVPYDLDLQLNGIQYLGSNALPQPLPRPQHQLQLQLQRPPFVYGYTQPPPRLYAARPPPPPGLGFQQSKQFAYAPPPQRGYAAGHRIPLPYPPSFISITTRRPSGGYGASHQKPFRPSQPDPTPDLFAGRASKSLLDSYIPSWEVLRLLQQTQPQSQSQSQPHPYSSHGPVQRHTLAYPVARPLRLVKRGSEGETVKKSLQANV